MTNTRRLTADMLNDPLFIGFDKMFNKLQTPTPGQSNYPPYNIVKTGENFYELELAVAGFKQEELTIELKDGILYVEGQKEPDEDKKYLHKGISARQFRRSFTLADTIVVAAATFVNGILSITLENVIPEEKKPRRIEIGTAPELLKG